MKYLHLIWAGMFRRKVRTILMLLSINVAFLLYGPLETVRSTFENFGQSSAGHDRLLTVAKLNPGLTPLPMSLYHRIKEVPGVTAVHYAYYFPASYQDPKNNVSIEAHPPSLFDLYPDLALIDGERESFQRGRTAALVGRALAERFNWKVGDKIPLQSSEPRKDGSSDWTFDVVGIYRFTDPGIEVWESTLFVNWDGFDATRLNGGGNVGSFASRVHDVRQINNIAHAIDALSANSSHETKTQSENAFSAGLISQIGDFGLIVTTVMSAVFFTSLLLTGHTIAQATQERVKDFGVLKAIGFSNAAVLALVLSESILLLLVGGASGLALATVAVNMFGATLSSASPVPVLAVGSEVWLKGLALAVLIGVLVGALPALRGLRLQIVDALAGR